MIFLTIGFQFSFDRLIKEMDRITPKLNGMHVIAQVSQTRHEVENMESHAYVKPAEFENYFQNATLIISHAGMGTILSALESERPIIVMPRLKKYGELTTDHQISTARKLEKLNYVHVAYDETELESKVLKVLNGDLKPLHKISKHASKQLLDSISSFLNSN